MLSPLFQRILFPTDFSACAEGAYRHAAYLADRFGAELHVVHAVDDPAAPPRDWPEAPGTGEVRISLAEVCEDLGLPLPPPAEDYDPYDLVEVIEAEVIGTDPAGAILRYARDEEVDLIVMGTHGRQGWARGVLGSVAETVSRYAPCPVLTVRPLDAPGEAPWPPSKVLLALDEVPEEGFATVPPVAARAARLAVAYQAPLEIVHVVPQLALDGREEADAERLHVHRILSGLGSALRTGPTSMLSVSVRVVTGDPAAAIAEVAEADGAHLLVVGTHARQGASRVLLGSVAEELVRTAPCPVLVSRDTLLAEA
jgi:nucleotide-binding universal stress UspA family protein